MTIPEALEKISKALAVLAHQTGAENLGGLFSKNRLTEDLLLPVFRIALNAPHLRNVNQKKLNFPYIDLADDQFRLAVQVTTERGAEKITETLKRFIAKGYHEQYDRLVFFILTASGMRYATKSKNHWKTTCGSDLQFDPSSDVITILDLFPIIQALPHSKVFEVHDVLAQSVIGEKFVDVEVHLNRQWRRQIEYEKKSGKYIPDIFVETQETKDLARNFTHPILFFRRTLDSLGRINISGSNRFLDKAGLPALSFPEMSSFRSKESLQAVSTAATALSTELNKLTMLLAKYERVSDRNPPPFSVKRSRRHFYEKNTYTLSNFASGLGFRLKDRLNELTVTNARVLILTGRAGQGKTNLVCDFVENFLSKHGVPCAYFSGRQISAMKTVDVGEAIHRLIFEGKTQSFAEAAHLLSAQAERANKPFVLVIDGLNEHHRISEFADQLEQFILSVIEHPNLRLFLTCRSEFFKLRFANLVAGPLEPHTYLIDGSKRRFEEERHDELLTGYFKFFDVRRDLVSDHVVEALKKDVLLLRFFCEAYGAKDKSESYTQQWIGHIYREQIFRIYLESKLGTAEAFLQRATGKLDPAASKIDLLSTLEFCVKYMLQQWHFSDVPVSVIPRDLREALFTLVDEELILRRDIPQSDSIFSQTDEAINFTFDELRDFLLAQYLIKIFETDRRTFEQYITRNDPKDSQIVEGIKRYLFYASRRPENEEFWKIYSTQSWYKDVYDYEVFSIDSQLLRADDREIVLAALKAGGERARGLRMRSLYLGIQNTIRSSIFSFCCHSLFKPTMPRTIT